MTASEREWCRARDYGDTRAGVGCLLVGAALSALVCGVVLIAAAGIRWFHGDGFDVSRGLELAVALPIACMVLALVVSVLGWVGRPLRRLCDPRRAEYGLVDEVRLVGAEAFISYDPHGHEVDSMHGKVRVYEEEYLLVIAPQRILYFADHCRGDIPIYRELTADGRESPYGAFPSDCRMVFRARDGMLMEFESRGALVDAIGSYRVSQRPPVVAQWLKRRRPQPLILRGEMGRAAELKVIEGGWPAALGDASMA